MMIDERIYYILPVSAVADLHTNFITSFSAPVILMTILVSVFIGLETGATAPG